MTTTAPANRMIIDLTDDENTQPVYTRLPLNEPQPTVEIEANMGMAWITYITNLQEVSFDTWVKSIIGNTCIDETQIMTYLTDIWNFVTSNGHYPLRVIQRVRVYGRGVLCPGVFNTLDVTNCWLTHWNRDVCVELQHTVLKMYNICILFHSVKWDSEKAKSHYVIDMRQHSYESDWLTTRQAYPGVRDYFLPSTDMYNK